MTIKRKISFTLTAVAVLLAAVTYLVILPMMREITGIVQAIHQEREDLEVKYRRGQQIRKITTEFKKIQTDVIRLNMFYLPAGQELDFITTLETIARRHGIDLDKTTELTTAFPSPDAPLPLTLTLQGNFTQIIRYLLELEQLELYFNISRLSLRGKSPQTGEVTAIITGRAFRKARELETLPPAATGSTDGDLPSPAPTPTPSAAL